MAEVRPVAPAPASAPAAKPAADSAPQVKVVSGLMARPSLGFSIKSNELPVAEIPVIQANVEPLTQQRIEALWAQAGEELGLAELLRTAKPVLADRGKVILNAQTTLFDNDFKPHRIDVVQWLRKQTGMPMLDCTVKALYVEKDSLPYSPDDKYQYMLKQNPNLAKLRQLFPQIDY